MYLLNYANIFFKLLEITFSLILDIIDCIWILDLLCIVFQLNKGTPGNLNIIFCRFVVIICIVFIEKSTNIVF